MRHSFMDTRNQSEFQNRLQAEMERRGMDALILTQPESVFYATGFMGCAHYRFRICGNTIAVVPSHGRVTLIVSEFEAGGAKLQTKGDVDIQTYPVWIYIEDFDNPDEKEKEVQPDLFRTFNMAADLVQDFCSEAVVGVESPYIPYDKYCFLIERFGTKHLENCGPLLTRVKLIKTPWEIDICRYTAKVAEKVMNKVMETTHEGMTETDIVRNFTACAYEFTDGGAELTKVNNVHTVGPCYWSALVPREYSLKKGDIVRLDGGVQVYGYLSDLGRTFAVDQEPDPERRRIYEILLRGFDAEMGMMGPGVKLSDVFRHTMEVIRKNGLPTYVRGHFGHTTGSGLTEDYPMISSGDQTILEPGMVFCLETPYYSTRHHSYNIEDEIVITEYGFERFTTANRTLLVH